MLTRMARFDQMASAADARRGAVLRQRIGSATTSKTAGVVSDDGCTDSARDPAPCQRSQAPAADLSHYDTKDSPFLELGNHVTAWCGSMACPTERPATARRLLIPDVEVISCTLAVLRSTQRRAVLTPAAYWQLANVLRKEVPTSCAGRP